MIKKMTLLSGLLIGLLIFTNCSNSDDNNTQLSADSIIGTWQPIKAVKVFDDGTESIDLFDVCFKQTKFSFYKNFEVYWERYEEDPQTDECILDLEDPYLEGSWKKLSNGNYEFNLRSYGTENGPTDYRILSFSEILFPDSNTMQIKSNINEVENGITLLYEYVEYKRIE